MKRVIKKYPNRRLYDMESSRYITLDEVQNMIINHIDIQVIDSQTEEDLTNHVLLQIINEQETGPTPLFTTLVLENLIRFYGHTAQPMMREFFEQAMKYFGEQQHQLQNQISEMMSGEPLETFKDFTQQGMNTWQHMMHEFLSGNVMPNVQEWSPTMRPMPNVHAEAEVRVKTKAKPKTKTKAKSKAKAKAKAKIKSKIKSKGKAKVNAKAKTKAKTKTKAKAKTKTKAKAKTRAKTKRKAKK